MVTVMQRLALFDLDDTLIDRTGMFHRWVVELAAAHGIDAEEIPRLLAEDNNGLGDRLEYLETIIARYGLTTTGAALHRWYFERMPALALIRPEVRAGLLGLRAAGWHVGVVTNGSADLQHAKMASVGLLDMLDGWAISGAEGVDKPERAIFEIAAGRCGLDLAAGGWMVGDSLDLDILGGSGVGLKTIFIQGYGPQTGPVEPDWSVADVLDAFGILLADR